VTTGTGTADLLARRRQLLEHCADQRTAVAAHFLGVTAPLGAVDRRLAGLDRRLTSPVLVAVALAIAVALGQRLRLGRLGALASVASAGWTLRRLLRTDPASPRRGTGP
jgi:hypothetical protein